MASLATVKEQVKESLVGTEEVSGLSAQTRAQFYQGAKKDEQTGDLYLDENAFIDAMCVPATSQR
jgi:solute carrier family 25 (mitochondrial aspartate/glutamate transporter), member 12/13